MDFKNIVIPYLSNAQIERKAGLFREKFWGNGVPIDIENIIDIKLKIYVIPVPGFLQFANYRRINIF